MKLLRLRLENFRQHAATEVRFEDGMTAIVGANGTGKSTLLEAITFALYGEQRSKKDTIRFYWSTSKKYHVALGFSLEDREFEVTRTNDDAVLQELIPNAVVLANGLREVTRATEQLLGLTYEHFVNSYCAEQKGLAFLNFKDNSVRQREVGRMLGLNRLEEAEQRATDRRKEAKSTREALERVLGNEAERKAELSPAAEKVREREEQIRVARATLAAKEAQLPAVLEAKNRADQYRVLSAKIGEAQAEGKGLKTALENARTQLASATEEAKLAESLAPIETLYTQAESELRDQEAQRRNHEKREALASQIEQLQAQIQQNQLALTELAASIPKETETGLTAAKAAHEAATVQLAATELAKRERLRQKREVLTRLKTEQQLKAAELKKAEAQLASGNCPECGQPFGGDFRATIDARRQAMKELTAELNQASQSVAEEEAPDPLITQQQGAATDAQAALEKATRLHQGAQTQKATLQEKEKQLQQQRQRVEELQTQRAALSTTFDPAKFEALGKRLAELRPKHEKFLSVRNAPQKQNQQQKLLEEADNAYNQAKVAYLEVKQQRDALGFETEEAASNALAAHQRLSEELATTRTTLQLQEKGLIDDQRHRTQAEDRWKQFQDQVAEVRTLAKSEALFDEAAKQFRALRLELNRTMRPELEARAGENLSLLTAGRYVTLELDENFKATLRDDDTRKEVISGGEEDVVALALRLALSELIQERNGRPLSLLVLDEVFGSLDTDRRQAVLDRLAALKGRFAQILVISHIEEINQVADQCLYVSRDPGTRASTVTDAVPLTEVLVMT